MDASITVAIITGIISVIVAVISSIVTIVTSRRASRAEKANEAYKQWLEYVQQGVDTKRNAVEARLKTLGDACKHIQTVRDTFRNISNSTRSKREYQKQLGMAVKSLQDLYASSHFTLPDLERSQLHDAKDIAKQLEHLLEQHSQSSISNGANECLTRLGNIQVLLVKDYEKWHTYHLQSYSDVPSVDSIEKLLVGEEVLLSGEKKREIGGS